MFRGQYSHAIDAQGRTSLPSRFREVLAASGDTRPIVTRSPIDPACLQLYPQRAWEELEAQIASMPRFKPEVVMLRRLHISPAVECDLDKQGRILVPPSLREYAGLVKEVVWAGMGTHAEIWASERWKTALAMSESELEAFKSALANLSL